MVNILIQIILLLYFSLLYINNGFESYIDKNFFTLILILDLISILSFTIIRKENFPFLKKQYLRITNLFLLSFLIVHFQAYIDFLLGNLDADDSFIWYDIGAVNKSIVICSMGLVSFFLGYSLIGKKRTEIKTFPHKISNTRVLTILAIGFLVLFYSTVDSAYLNGNYGKSEKGSLATYSSLLLESIIAAIIIIKSRNLIAANKKNVTILEYLRVIRYPFMILLIYLVGVMISGDRGPIIYSLLGIGFLYIYVTKRKIPAIQILFFIFLSSLLITILGLIRREDKNLSFSSKLSSVVSSDEIEVLYYPQSFSNNTKELASSVRTVHIAVSNVPFSIDHFKGLFALQDCLLIIPSGKGTFISILNLPPQLTSSPQFLTFITLGPDASWGVGTSCIADTYLDFGGIGVIIAFFIFGFIVRRLEIVAYSSSMGSIFLIICAFLFFSYSIYIPRATLIYPMNKFLFILFFVLLSNFINKKYSPQ